MRIRILELRTTGEDERFHAPCEVGYADLVATGTVLENEIASWEIGPCANYLCNPGRYIPPQASAVHHILNEDVRGMVSWAELLDEIVPPERHGAVAFASHQISFTRRWATDAMTEHTPWIDTYRCALRLWPEAPSYQKHALRYWLKLPVQREEADKHKAGAAALVVAHILRRMLDDHPLEHLLHLTGLPTLQERCRIRSPWLSRRWAAIDDERFLQWVAGDPAATSRERATAAFHLARLKGRASDVVTQSEVGR
ncbi:hypothetical protein [Rhodomicrobium lacus]|uniref:3'-5' exonuclease n=1 Tax=Rhodomicrobium lacus TaxID=2498452 RepID=UPI000F8CC450|nr:hypothetical protein [Rhodomicrobium lacus]